MTHAEVNVNNKNEVFNAVKSIIASNNTLEGIEGVADTKSALYDGIGAVVLSLQEEGDKLRAEEKALAEKRRVLEEKQTLLEEYLLENLKGQSFEGSTARIEIRQSTSVAIEDEAAVPDKYIRIKREVKKTDALKLLREGQKIPGLILEEKENIKVKPSKA